MGTLAIFEEITSGFLFLDKRWRVTYLNATAAKLLSAIREPDPSVTFHLWNTFPELRSSTFYVQLHRASALREPVEFQEFLKPVQRWLEVRCYPSEDGLILFLHDITLRKHLEEELATTEQQYRALFDGALDAGLVLDDERRCIDANPAACQLLGLPRARVLGRTTEEFYGLPAKEVVKPMWQDFLKLGFQTGELRLHVSLGTVRDVEYASKANFLPGRHLSILHDITARKQVERHLRLQHAIVQTLAGCRSLPELRVNVCRAIAESAGWQAGGFWEVSSSREVLKCLTFRCEPGTGADGWEALFQELTLRRGEELPGRVWASGEADWVADLSEQDDSHRGRLAAQAGMRSAFALPILIREGVFGVVELFSRQPEPFGVNLLPVLQAVGHQAGQFIERERAEQHRDELLASERAARAEAERAVRAREMFLAVVSHELRTPLTAILGYGRLLRTREPDGATLAMALEVIERNASAVVQLVEDLLDHSRISSGKLRLTKAPVDLAPLVVAAIESFRPAADANHIDIEGALEEGPSIVLGGASRLQQVVSNLLSNAVKFTPENGRIEVRLERRGSRCAVVVSDTGIGIKPEFLPHLFEPFSQADACPDQSRTGFGLGLSVVGELVRLHGGQVTAQSAGPGTGAKFTVTLPLSTEAPARLPSGRELSSASARLRNVRILAVDDDADTREFVSYALCGYGAEVVAVDSVRRALQSLQHFGPQVIVTDIAMPRADGYALIRQVRALASRELKNIPVVALTAYVSAEERERALRAGFTAFLAKPVDPADLAATIADLLKPQHAGRMHHG